MKPHGYDIDVVGGCNLRCPSCPQGNSQDLAHFKGVMKVELFRSIMEKIARETPKVSDIGLFNWAEPLLHPQLPELIRLVNHHGFPCHLSSNLNLVREDFAEVFKARPAHFRVSISGSKSANYSQTHQRGNIERVIQNMYKIREILNKLDSKTHIEVLYHRYIHNMGEDYERIAELSWELGFEFHPVWAYLMPLEKSLDYFAGKISAKDMKIIELFAIRPEEARKISLKYLTSGCYLRSCRTAINSDGSVALCCGTYDQKNDIADSFLGKTHDELHTLKNKHPLCGTCMKNGLHVTAIYGGIHELNALAEKKLEELKKERFKKGSFSTEDKLVLSNTDPNNPWINKFPKVSIGMPVYNAEKYVKQAIESILAQDYLNIELIIVDNASTDRTKEIIQSFLNLDQRIRFYENDKNIGSMLNFKRTFDLSSGKYFMWASHDDFFLPSYVRKCVQILEHYPKVVLCTSKIVFVDEQNRRLANVEHNELHTFQQDIVKRVQAIVSRFGWYSIFGVMRREILEKIWLEEKMYGFDVVQLLQISILGEIYQISEYLFFFRERPRTIRDVMVIIDPANTNKSNFTPITELTQGLMNAITYSDLDNSTRALLKTEIMLTIITKNVKWRNSLLSENPHLIQYLDLDGTQADSLPIRMATLITNYFSSLSFNENGEPVDHRKILKVKNAELISPTKIKEASLSPQKGYLRVLFQNRPQAYQYPGGDTIVMKRLQEGLEKRGVKVDYNWDLNADLSHYDIVHAFNFTLLNEMTDKFAQNALKQNIPFVATPLQEDFLRYDHKAKFLLEVFKKYIESGKDQEILEKGIAMLNELPVGNMKTSPLAAKHADLIFTCGKSESNVITRLFPDAKVTEILFGSDIKNIEIGPELFTEKFGIKDFVLCVARLESRKNQLMLLKALENEDIPVVLVDGGHTHQPVYKELCQRYKRKGRTILTGRISEEMLVSAYRAAKVHCLPSWYELPGLVTLEAARYGCNVVASDWGAIRDYMGEHLFYCQPDNPESIRNAVMQALEAPRMTSQIKQAEQHTWDKYAETVYQHYLKIINNRNSHRTGLISFQDSLNTRQEDSLLSIKADPAIDYSIIVVTYNSCQHLPSLLDSINQYSLKHEIILVDNASTDGTQEFLKQRQDIRLVIKQENLGFSRAVNQGIAQARGKYIVLLNPDTRVTPGWLERMRFHFVDPGTGAVGPLSNYVAGLQKIQLYYNPPAGQAAGSEQIAETVSQRYRYQSIETKLLIGFCLMIPRQVMVETGGLDEDLFLGNDDLELSWRLRNKGYCLRVALDAFVFHQGQESFKTREKSVTDDLVQQSTDTLYRKLSGSYGRGMVPCPQELWGINWFTPSDEVYRGRIKRFEQEFKTGQNFLIPHREYVKGKVSIVVLTCNQLDYTKMCLESIKRNTTKVPYEMIFVDNGSSDGTAEFLRTQKDFKSIFNAENRGVAAGWNQGLKQAEGEYLLILNNDVLVTPGWLENLLKILNENQITGAVGPKSNYVAGTQIEKNPGYRVIEDLDAFAQKYQCQHAGQSSVVEVLFGLCFLVKREVLNKVGLFDDRFGLGNFEDNDYCLRLRLKGYQLRIAEEVYLHHFGSKTFTGNKIDWREQMSKNKILFEKKWDFFQEEKRWRIPENRLEDWLSQGRVLIESGKIQDAIPLLLKILENNPNHAEAYQYLGFINAKLGRDEDAFKLILKSIDLDPTSTDALINLYDLAISLGRTKMILPVLMKAVEMKPDLFEIKQLIEQEGKNNAAEKVVV